ncbi:putative P-loop containing nucleoside triphosphate hydrolase [Medicago truncatula]|uniref:Putative P-loop containing nucleoside triphosphate hydrolase n=1 Tax=Medicago truncatula TaxID=3880 RepID=A0A396ILF7_MEDTR|nr:putative disease resistance RPP13-like protein 1 [Medicago truncatula]RHN65661.1 putative P-loop containing nucleoside triphosphate hydrolase [Medicago truncatula]
MATVVGEALLSASVKLLLQKMVSSEFIDFFWSMKLDVALLEKLKITLLSLQAVLNDAEEKQITNPAVKEWLNMLQDAVFEAEDLFDEINTESLRCKVEAEYETQSAKVLKKLSSRFKRFNRKMNSKLQKLLERLEHLRNQNLGLKEGVSNSVWHGTPTSSVVGDESAIYGRDDDKKKLKEFLLAEDVSDCGRKIGVISIVGMGGLGKTTLAKILYNDHDVKQKFEVRGWAHISKDFDVVIVTKTILESVTSKRNDTDDLNILQVKLQQCLSNTKFLLVLDDIWYGNYVDCWNNLADIFSVGEIGSRIIITTRNERVAATMQTFLPIHKLEPLQ